MVLDKAGYGKLGEKRATELCAAAFSIRDLEIGRVGELSVALIKARDIRKLNLRFRGIDAPTDVLSFEMDGLYGEMAGEVVISPDCVSPEVGVDELVVHGALHLSGMDHGDDFEQSEMFVVQNAVMEMVDGPKG